jgi:hypothetical protein
MAVEDNARPPAIIIAESLSPVIRTIEPAIRRTVINTCKEPSPKTYRLIALSLSIESSSPIANNKNTTPYSAS